MKLVALALALLLAVGSHAAALQADAPSQLDHIRSAVSLYLGQVKDSATKALDHLDDTEYGQYKAQLVSSLDTLQAQLQAAQASAAPYTDAVAAQVMSATNNIHTSVLKDMESLRTELEPKRAELQAVIEKHLEEYRAQLEPIIKDHSTKYHAEMEDLKAKLDPVVAALRNKLATNVEETKSALMPIVEAVRTRLIDRLEDLKTFVAPHVEEWKDQLNVEGIQTQVAQHIANLRGQASPMAEDAKAKLMAFYEAVAASINKN